MTIDITDYCYVNGCSVVGLMVDETVPVRELFYGTILSSGADAALGLATYVAGSQEAFVALMNEKLGELGIADTAHFTNCVGPVSYTHLDPPRLLRRAADDGVPAVIRRRPMQPGKHLPCQLPAVRQLKMCIRDRSWTPQI